MSIQSRREREQKHRREVEANKKRLRQMMQTGEHVYGEEHYREALREGEYARADALEEMLPDIREHNNRVGGGTRRRIHDEISRVASEERERARERDLERARRSLEDSRRSGPRGIGGLGAANAGRESEDFNPGLQVPTSRRGRRRIPGRGRPPYA